MVSMMACDPEDLGSIPHLAKVHNDVIFFLGVFMIQFNLINLIYVTKGTLMVDGLVC